MEMKKMGQDQGLELLLSSAIAKDAGEEKAKENKNKIRMTKGVYEKVKLYAELTSRITGTGMECYGYLLRPKWSTDDVITNVYFADEQVVSQAYVMVTEEGIRQAIAAVDAMDSEIVGWWHSHGSLEVFHSGTDVQNFRRILDGIAPHTLYRHVEAPFAIDEEHNRIVFEDYSINNLSPEILGRFKEVEEQLRTVKKVEQEPFAFSMVVNNREDRYLEKITKKKDPRTLRYQIQPPIHPQFELVDVKDDLEFMVADVEWEVREKIISGSGRLGTTRRHDPLSVIAGNEGRNPPLEETCERFVKQLELYARFGGKYASSAYAMLFEQDELYPEIAVLRQNGRNIVASVVKKKADTERDDIQEKIAGYFGQMDESRYSSWKDKINMFERQRILARRFMEEFVDSEVNATRMQRLEEQTKVMEKYHNIALRLNGAFEVADKGMKALTKYAMETITDYTGKKGHEYRNFIGAILTRLSTAEKISFEDAVQDVVSSPKGYSRNKIFIWEDRFDICNQLLMDAYRLKIGSIYKNPVLTDARKKTVEFIEDFAAAYANSPEDADALIEKHLLGDYGVSDEKYAKYKDLVFEKRQKREKTRGREYDALGLYSTTAARPVERVVEEKAGPVEPILLEQAVVEQAAVPSEAYRPTDKTSAEDAQEQDIVAGIGEYVHDNFQAPRPRPAPVQTSVIYGQRARTYRPRESILSKIRRMLS